MIARDGKYIVHLFVFAKVLEQTEVGIVYPHFFVGAHPSQLSVVSIYGIDAGSLQFLDRYFFQLLPIVEDIHTCAGGYQHDIFLLGICQVGDGIGAEDGVVEGVVPEPALWSDAA